MDTQAVISTIQLVLAPVVMVSACAMVLGGLLSRYAAINDRLRLVNRERFELLRAAGATPHTPAPTMDAWTVERLAEIDAQTPDLLRRHHLTHNAVLTVYYAIALFVLSMFAIAIGASTGAAVADRLVLLLFLAGMAVLLIVILLTAVEVRSSHVAVEYETRRISLLGAAPTDPPRKA